MRLVRSRFGILAPMTRKPSLGETYIATNSTEFIWRVDRLLDDDVHVVLVCDQDPSRRKTVSISALGDPAYFARVTPRAA